MLPDGRRLGAHLPLAAGLVKAADRAAAIGADTIQMFVDNPTAWRRRAAPPKELPRFRERVAALGLGPMAVHASYLVNLAGADDAFYHRSIAVLASDMRAAADYGARYINVHAGSHGAAGVRSGTKRIADAVVRVLEEAGTGPDGPRLVLENSAGGGWGLGSTVESLSDIDRAIQSRGVDRDRLGFCLDTAHLWGAGVRLRERSALDALTRAFDRKIGLDRLVMIHLNDSRSDRGSRMDRHQHVGAGQIGEEAMARILTHPAFRHATYFIETPGMDEGYDAINICRAIALAEGRPLEPLPPGALELRGSRSRSAAPAEEPDDEADDQAIEARPTVKRSRPRVRRSPAA